VRGHGAVMLEALRKVPQENVRACAELSLATAGLLLDAGLPAGAEEFLDIARELGDGLPEERRQRLWVAFTATDLYRARLNGNVEEALSSARGVLSGDWERHVATEVRALTLACLGIAEFWDDRVNAAQDHLRAAVGIARECGNDYVLFLAQAYAAGADLRQGRLDESWRRAQSAVELAAAGGWTGAAQAGIAYLVLARVYLHWNDLDAAAEHLARARATLQSSEERLARQALAFMEAQLLGARGDLVTALDMLRGGLTDAPPALPRSLRVSCATLEADLLLALGDRGEARDLLEKLARSESVRDVSVAQARLELADGNPEAALAAVATFLADGRDALQPNAVIEAWVIDAVARAGLRDEDEALRSLERAMELAEPRGYRRPFVRHAAPVRSLMRRRIRAGTAHRAFAGELLAALGEEHGQEQTAAGPLLEALSERELAVLRYLPTMMSNAEIASELFVSVNTVKTHLKHVYRKLDVSDRREAVRRGRELRLLSPGLGDRAADRSS
jgi:LuxR family transcriptional regulator, maltose regulon positive regulatory protein